MTDRPRSPPPTRPVRDSLRVRAGDGPEATLELDLPAGAGTGLLWLPALGVAARHYEPLARALAETGIAVARHEWRGLGSSTVRASRACDWSYRELLVQDLPASLRAARAAAPQVRWYVGGHSLGAQLAALALAFEPEDLHGLVIVAGGVPWWRHFPPGRGLAFRAILGMLRPLLAATGHFPGRRLGFGGREARGVMRDWAASAISGRYGPAATGTDAEAALAAVQRPVLGVWFDQDALVPRAAFDALLDRIGGRDHAVAVFGRDELGGLAADHFSWMKQPGPVARQLAGWLHARA